MKNISAAIIDKNPTTNEIIKQYLSDNSKIAEFHQFLDLNNGYDFICKNPCDMVFIDLSFGNDESLEITEKIYKNNKDCKIVLTSNYFEADLIIKAMKLGAKETLLKPIIKKDFDSLITKLVNQINYNGDFSNSKVISVFSNKGGLGKTTIATNMAIEIANITKKPTLIIDFNSQFGDVSTFLNVKTEFGISYLLNNKDKWNKDFITTNLPQYKDSSLYVLSDLFSLNDVKDISLEDVQNIIDAMRLIFSYIIIDSTNILDLKTVKILDNSDEILFPVLANMPNLRNCQRCLDFFRKIGYSDKKVKVILNRFSQNDEITCDSIEKTIGKKIYSKLANDYFIIMASINRGVGVSNIDADSNIAKSIQNLVYSFIDKE